MHQISQYDRHAPGRLANIDAVGAAASLPAVLWRRRWIVCGAVLACVAAAGLYLLVSTSIFSASAKVLVEQTDADALGERRGPASQSETYVQTQADVFQSASVLKRALDAVNFRTMKTFTKVGDDPVGFLRRGGALKVDVAKKSDVVVVTMESPWPEEAAAVANSIVKEYIAELALRKRAAGAQMLQSLEKEKAELKAKREELVTAMQKFKSENDVISLGADRGNTALERTATLSSSLTTAEMTAIDLRSQLAATKRALADPASLSAFVEAQQFKAKDAGDHEYDELRSQLIQQMLALSTSSALEGPRNSRVMTLEAVVTALRRRVADKERAIAQAHLVSVSTQLAAAEENEKQLRKASQSQRAQVLNLGPQAMEYLKMESEVARMQKQCELLENRIGDITVNEMSAPPMNVRFLEPARVETRPIKPNKLLVMLAALMVGWVAGIGIALVQEWRDARFRNPQEILSLLGTSVLGLVPRINARLSPVARGQILYLDTHSPSAEAYRSVRTSLHLGAYRESKTILLASATPGEGKSTTASNLAIAFAQAGHRTLLIDCDMREPVLHLIFETSGAIGVSSVIAGEEKLADAIQRTRVPGLYLLPCGPVPANPSELLAGKRFGHLMRALLGTFDRIVLDSPPLLMANDARIIAASADATLIVLRMNHSTHRAAIQAMEELEKVGAHVLGAVANDVPALRANSYYRGSWQYASSAKRIIASVGGEPGAGESARPGKKQLLVDAALAIIEPNWSAEDGPASNTDKFRSEKPAETGQSAVSGGSISQNGGEW